MSSAKVFIVHGRDLLAREAVARLIRDLGLEPVVLGHAIGVGETWIEGLETTSRGVNFAVVIFKADQSSSWSELQGQTARVRQNVLFELGYMIGKLGRANVCVLYEPGVEVPSDYAGAKFIRLDNEWDWKLNLTVALKEAGLPVKISDVLDNARVDAPADQEFIRDHARRTRQIISDLRALAAEPTGGRKELRFSGFLSAFALGDHEMSKRRDGTLLTEERDALAALARRGCRTSCIVSMPNRIINEPEVLLWRLTTLLTFLKSGDPALEHIYWAVAPRVESYVYVIGSLAFYQGFKSDDDLRGFTLTERRTSRDELHRQIALFDQRFNIHAAATLQRGDFQRRGDQREDLLHATIRRIEVVCETLFAEGSPG
jgi:hypothetical protein